MLQKIFMVIPVPFWFGLILSLVAVGVHALFGFGVTTVFAILFAFFWIGMYSSEYKLPFDNFLVVSVFILLGHIPYLLVHFLS